MWRALAPNPSGVPPHPWLLVEAGDGMKGADQRGTTAGVRGVLLQRRVLPSLVAARLGGQPQQ